MTPLATWLLLTLLKLELFCAALKPRRKSGKDAKPSEPAGEEGSWSDSPG